MLSVTRPAEILFIIWYLLRQCVRVRALRSQMRHTRQQPLDNQLKQRLIENKEKEGVAGGSIRILLVPDVREE